MENCRHGCCAAQRVIDVNVGNIRKKIDRDKLNPCIHTVRHVGFILHATH
ncbi:winged helix-turn-helix domain-containing protein [Methylobacterium sp. PvR107]|nr:winged helix-turn-helix domain-containing protein [Methylobacterium sp. PvR107]